MLRIRTQITLQQTCARVPVLSELSQSSQNNNLNGAAETIAVRLYVIGLFQRTKLSTKAKSETFISSFKAQHVGTFPSFETKFARKHFRLIFSLHGIIRK